MAENFGEGSERFKV